MRRTAAYAAMTKDEAQRSIRTFYEAVKNGVLISKWGASFAVPMKKAGTIAPNTGLRNVWRIMMGET